MGGDCSVKSRLRCVTLKGLIDETGPTAQKAIRFGRSRKSEQLIGTRFCHLGVLDVLQKHGASL